MKTLGFRVPYTSFSAVLYESNIDLLMLYQCRDENTGTQFLEIFNLLSQRSECLEHYIWSLRFHKKVKDVSVNVQGHWVRWNILPCYLVKISITVLHKHLIFINPLHGVRSGKFWGFGTFICCADTFAKYLSSVYYLYKQRPFTILNQLSFDDPDIKI